MNAEMIIKVMGRITDENLDMNHWGRSPIPAMSCGTTMCFAGHTVVEAGHALAWIEDDGAYTATWTEDGHDIEMLAMELLGLGFDDAAELFFDVQATTVDELWEEVTRITGVKRPSLVPA